MDMPTPRTLVDLVRRQADARPDALLYQWLDAGDTETERIGFAELDQRVQRLAARLQTLCAPGDRIALLHPPGLEFAIAFLAVIYVGAVAVPAPLPRSVREQLRLRAILEDARPRLVLTTSAMQAAIGELLRAAGPRAPALLATDGAAEDTPPAWTPTDPGPETLAYLQYTSGSTALPKGVMISHRNVLENLAYLAADGDFSPESRMASWVPHFHDMGLVFGLLLPIFVGVPTVLFSPLAFVQRPLRWLRAISTYGVTHTGGPNFAYEMCVRQARSTSAGPFALEQWHVAFNGAEPISAKTLDRFAETFASSGFNRRAFYPVYGLAEATLKVTSARPHTPPKILTLDADALRRRRASLALGTREGRTVVGCGRPSGSHRVLIVNPDTAVRCRSGEIGEVWIAGPSVAQGYWRNPAATTHDFQARLSGMPTPTFLRTGDLGFRRGGELFITGRLKDCIIIRGQNYSPEEIEQTIQEARPDLFPNSVVAIAIEHAGQEALAIVIDGGKTPPPIAELAAAVRRVVAEQHTLPVAAVALSAHGALPKTSSGKLQRQTCREGFVTGSLEILAVDALHAPADELTATLPTREHVIAMTPAAANAMMENHVRRTAATLLNVTPAQIDLDVPLVALGFDSMRAVELLHRLESWLQSRQPLMAIPSVTGRELARRLLAALRDEPSATPSSSTVEQATEDVPLTRGQRALWFIQQLDATASPLHIVRALRVSAPLDEQRLRRILSTLMVRHRVLRGTIAERDGELWLRTRSDAEPPWIVDDAHDPGGHDRTDVAGGQDHVSRGLARELYAPFTDGGLLWRVRVRRTAPAEFVLGIAIHHVIADFWSLMVLLEELLSSYGGAALAPEPQVSMHEMSAFLRQEKAYLASEDGARALAFWRDRLPAAGNVLPLPADRRDDGVPHSRRAGVQALTLDRETFAALKAVGAGSNATTYAMTLGLLAMAIHRWTGERTISIASPTHGRDAVSLDRRVGYFVNLLLLQQSVAYDTTFRQICRQASVTIEQALEHARMPFVTLMEQSRRDLRAGAPVCQVMLAFQQVRPGLPDALASLAIGGEGQFALRGVGIESLPMPPVNTQCEWTWNIAEIDGELRIRLEYDARLYEPATVERLAAQFVALAGSVAKEPDRRVSELPIAAIEDFHDIRAWNSTAHPRTAALLHASIEQQLVRSPLAAKVTDGRRTLSSAALNAGADALADRLAALGVGPESVVGVCAYRSVELVTALLAVLKTGAAYLPLDPDEPAERSEVMARRAGARVILGQPESGVRFERLGGTFVSLEPWAHSGNEATRTIAAPALARSRGAVHLDQPAYVIFTSGSTGVPKGVMISHRAIDNRLSWMQERYRLTSDDCVLQKTPFTFDVSVWELFWPLRTGSRLVLAAPGGHRDPAYLVGLIEAERVTTLHFVPSMLAAFVKTPGLERCRSVRQIFSSGEALPSTLAQQVRAALPWAQLHNLYGPTEAAVDVTAWPCDEDVAAATVPIGRPIDNVTAYVLDEYLHPAPARRAGELYLGGVALARGYINDPAQTAARFVPDPMSEAPGQRLYRTGDLARVTGAGVIEYLGRDDQQHKVRGMRVELGEIDAALAAHPGIAASATVVMPGDQGNEIVAYFVSATEAAPTPLDLRQFLSRRLPDYMVPVAYLRLDALPLSSNGKLDRRGLPAPRLNEDRIVEPYVAPRTPIEVALAEIWTDLFRRPRIGVNDNFFDLGGHSLLAMQLVARVRERLDVDLRITVIFSIAPTIAALATVIEDLVIASVDEGQLAAAAQELAGLTDEEIHAQLASAARVSTYDAMADRPRS